MHHRVPASKSNLLTDKICPFCSVNVSLGPKEDRQMTTGRHTVSDIYCNCCQQIVGWKYVSRTKRISFSCTLSP